MLISFLSSFPIWHTHTHISSANLCFCWKKNRNFIDMISNCFKSHLLIYYAHFGRSHPDVKQHIRPKAPEESPSFLDVEAPNSWKTQKYHPWTTREKQLVALSSVSKCKLLRKFFWILGNLVHHDSDIWYLHTFMLRVYDMQTQWYTERLLTKKHVVWRTLLC